VADLDERPCVVEEHAYREPGLINCVPLERRGTRTKQMDAGRVW
jgi:hypothetical protein